MFLLHVLHINFIKPIIFLYEFGILNWIPATGNISSMKPTFCASCTSFTQSTRIVTWVSLFNALLGTVK